MELYAYGLRFPIHDICKFYLTNRYRYEEIEKKPIKLAEGILWGFS